MSLNYRVPDRQRLEWAQRVVAEMGDRGATNTTEIYAREQVLLHATQRTEIVLQALRIGDIAVAAIPTETYAVTGLKIKAASPLRQAMVIELANGGDGYIPPPEQHAFGGYNTWPALFVAFLGLLMEHVSKPLVVILDNASVHKAKATEPMLKLLRQKGLRLYFLPPYSPELNRIEKLWHKMKYEWMAYKARDAHSLETDVEEILTGFGEKYSFDFYR